MHVHEQSLTLKQMLRRFILHEHMVNVCREFEMWMIDGLCVLDGLTETQDHIGLRVIEVLHCDGHLVFCCHIGHLFCNVNELL